VKLAPNLRREKIVITFGKRTKNGRRVTVVRPVQEKAEGAEVPEQPSQPSHRHQGNEINSFQGDGMGDGLDFGEFTTVTHTPAKEDGAAAGDGLNGDGNADRHPNRHPVNHCEQRPGDGVTVVTVIPVPDDPTVIEPATVDPATGIPFVITRETRRRLYDLGYFGPDIDKMTPQRAWQTANEGIRRENHQQNGQEGRR